MRKALLLTIACLVMAGAVSAGTPKKFTVGHIQATDQAFHQALLKFQEYVEKESNGSIKVEIFPNSQLGDALTQISSVRMGTLTAFIDGVGWYGQLLGDYYIPATAYAIKNWDAYYEVMDGEIGQEMAEKLRQQFGLRVINQTWYRLPRNVMSVKPIRTIDDL